MNTGVLCYLIRDSVHLKRALVCLARKKQKIGAGLWNGYGGHVEAGEMPVSAAIREVFEEGKIKFINAHNVAQVTYFERSTQVGYRDLTNYSIQWSVNVFFGMSEFGKEPEETEEMGSPQWFAFDDVPYQEMLPADRLILPLIFIGDCTTFLFEADVYYGPEKKEVEWVAIRPF